MQQNAARRLSELQMETKDIQGNGVQATPNECDDAGDGSMTLAVDARLYFGTANNIRGPIVEVGGNVGRDLEVFADQYPNAQIFSYEPVPFLARYLEEYPVVATSNGRVRIIQAAVGKENSHITIFGGGNSDQKHFTHSLGKDIRNEGASEFVDMGAETGGTNFSAALVDIDTALRRARDETQQVPEALSINCEGCEYDLLPRLLETEWLGKLRFLQMSWHLPKLAGRLEIHCLVSRKLREAGYRRVYKSYFGWEGWALPCDKSM